MSTANDTEHVQAVKEILKLRCALKHIHSYVMHQLTMVEVQIRGVDYETAKRAVRNYLDDNSPTI